MCVCVGEILCHNTFPTLVVVGNRPSREMMISAFSMSLPVFLTVFYVCHQAYPGVTILSARSAHML